ncbi:serine/threonine-protein kinase [Streptomyces sp. WMMB 322]|uniref:serine/threonine-protein kinase n=1 Tax=Streptomyces sp. WMMB 322 TaxID=1286821 RepID=UPI0006E38B3C|nr:serine/threonine-protein kinase [Streptomyces sp. WMMB 322]SCK28543.1 serine/threonine protein kinase [Streptomyces sp. WMMB 322]
MSEHEGRLVGGRYRLGGVLGRGGMGTVWRGEDEVLGRSVAVKELRFPSSVEEDEKQRLITRTLREAKAIARIRSGSAVTVFDVVDEDDRPWIVMELVEGGSLADHIRTEGPLTPQRAAEVGLAVLDVLRAAHREGVLHRDVKPSNVLLEDVTGRVVLTDFGIAKVEGDPSVTSTGMLVGAPSYISPERARGKPPGPPADLWSLGALLYAAVEGHPPYDKGSAISTLTAVMTEDVPPPEQAGELEEVIFGLLTKDPDKRLDVAGARALLEPVALGKYGAGAGAAAAQDGGTTAVLPPKPDGTESDASEAAEAGEAGRGDGGGDQDAEPGEGEAKPASGRGSSKKPASGRGTSKKPASGRGTSKKPASGRGTSKKPASGGAAVAGAAAAGAAGSGSAAGDAESGGATGGDGDETPAPTGSAALAHSGDKAAAHASTGSGGGAGGALTGVSQLAGRVSRRSLAIVAVAAVAVLTLIAVLALNNRGGGESGDNSSKGTASSGAKGTERDKGEGGAGTKKEDKSGEDKASASPDPSASAGSGEDEEEPGAEPSLPEDYEQVTDKRFHFSIAMPEDFERSGVAGTNSGAKYSDGGVPKLQVDFSPKPLKDAAAGWRDLEPSVKSNSSGYRQISIKSKDWRGYPTVGDWQFERDEDGRKVRVLNRGFRVDDSHGYAIMITCRADKWDDKECKTLRKTAFSTFKPLT